MPLSIITRRWECHTDKVPAEPDDSNNSGRITSDVTEEGQSSCCSSPNIIESTPEKLEYNLKTGSDDPIDTTDNADKLESQEVKFLHVNQFRLSNDNERTMCIKQQKNSWLQLNDFKKDFQSVIEKPSATGPLSTLKRDRDEHNEEKRVKRKISDYFSPKH